MLAVITFTIGANSGGGIIACGGLPEVEYNEN
jgi:hypothetical protein